MNCQRCQQQISESLATGASVLPPEVAAHESSCLSCREFYAAQQTLFQSIDAGLHSFANQPVPPSLLPSVRARLDDMPAAQPSLIPHWRTVVVAAVAILALAVSYALRRPIPQPDFQQHASVAVQSTEDRQAAAPETHPEGPEVARASAPAHVSASLLAKRASTSTSSSASEVIVLPEERAAFAQFVAEVPTEREVALALTQPAAPMPDAAVQIALLQIAEVEVKPLEGTPRE
jgi:hypothetical protein